MNELETIHNELQLINEQLNELNDITHKLKQEQNSKYNAIRDILRRRIINRFNDQYNTPDINSVFSALSSHPSYDETVILLFNGWDKLEVTPFTIFTYEKSYASKPSYNILINNIKYYFVANISSVWHNIEYDEIFKDLKLISTYNKTSS